MQEHVSNSGERQDTYILDPENAAEMARLEIQDRLLTQGMGGVLPEFENRLPPGSSRVLDIACGPGEWVRQIARLHPQAEVVGLDISQLMIAYAQVKAREASLTNARFLLGNILQPLDFAADSFDLINARLLGGVLRSEKWLGFLKECKRIIRPGGRIRLTESNDIGHTNSPATEQLSQWMIQATQQAGYGASTDGSYNITSMLCDLLDEAGYESIVQQKHTMDLSYGTPLYASQRQNYMVGYRQAEKFIMLQNITSPEAFQQRYDQMLAEVAAENFQGTWTFTTSSGQKP